jgi:hypothetical protein
MLNISGGSLVLSPCAAKAPNMTPKKAEIEPVMKMNLSINTLPLSEIV